MTSARLLLGYLLHRSVVQGHMPWATLDEEQTGLDVYFGEGLIPNRAMITSLENITELDFVSADGTQEKVPIALAEGGGYMTGTLPEDFDRAALAAGFLDYGSYGSSTLHYSFVAQANSEDPAKDWDEFLKDFSWVEDVYETGYTNSPLFATMKNYGGAPYEIAVNGIPGMASLEGCVYDVDSESGAEVKLGCTEIPVEDYDSDSMVVQVTSVELDDLCAGQTYLFRARSRGNFDPKIPGNISSYATGSVVWDSSGKTCLPDVPATSDADQSAGESTDGGEAAVEGKSGARSYLGVTSLSAAGIGMMFCSYVLIL